MLLRAQQSCVAAPGGPHLQRHRSVSCLASKTTRGTSQPGSRVSAAGTSKTVSSRSSQPAPAAQEAPRKGMQEHARDMQERLDSFVHFLTPKQEGDAGDVLMIGISMVVFIWLAMQMYRLYYYVYLQLGVMDMMQ